MTAFLAWDAPDQDSVIGVLRRRVEEGATGARVRDLLLPKDLRPWIDETGTTWGSTVLAFLFAQPGSSAMESIDRRGEYFSVRSGAVWDLFLPGYESARVELPSRLRAGSRYASRWSFNAEGFDQIRRIVETKSGGAWNYSGASDLVLINAWITPGLPPKIDWSSTTSGSLVDLDRSQGPLTFPETFELICRDLENQLNGQGHGIPRSHDPRGKSDPPKVVQDLFVSVASEIIAAIALKSAGL